MAESSPLEVGGEMAFRKVLNYQSKGRKQIYTIVRDKGPTKELWTVRSTPKVPGLGGKG